MLLVEKLLGSNSAATSATYVEDVFSTYLYTGTSIPSVIPNGIALGNGATTPGWISELATVTQTAVAADSSGNIYVLGTVGATTSMRAQITKYDSNGNLLWQRGLDTASRQDSVDRGAIKVDSSANVYICGTVGGTPTYGFVAKYDTDGTLLWQRNLKRDDGLEVRFYALDVSSGGNIYIVGANNNFPCIVKYNTSGTLQWERQRQTGNGATTNFSYEHISIDSSENAYVVGYNRNDDGVGNITNYGHVAKWNSAGTIQWETQVYMPTTYPNSQLFGIVVESGGNIYVGGYGSAGTTQGPFVAKLDTNGAILWQRYISNSYLTGSTNSFLALAYASASSLYAIAQATVGGIIMKFDTSGSLAFANNCTESINDIAVDSQGNAAIVGELYVYKLPSDGSGGGSYSTATSTASYFPTNITFVSSSAVASTTVFVTVSSSVSSSAGVMTGTTTSLTPSLISLAQGTGYGGLVWTKIRSVTSAHALYDSARGVTLELASNTSSAASTQTEGVTGFLANGYSIGTRGTLNVVEAIGSWTFRKQAKFFDVVTYTGNGANRTISHNLGSVPGCIIIKRTDADSSWAVYHRSLANTEYTVLNTTAAKATGATYWNSTTPTSSEFSLGTATNVNANNGTYVAYLFAHNAGGFGAAGTDNIISCGSFTTDENGDATISLGYEPQWLLVKNSTSTGNWLIVDNLRGWTAGGTFSVSLSANSINAEVAANEWLLTNSGFVSSFNAAFSTYVYVAIRRGPMKTPTTGTSVFNPVLYTGTNVDNRLVNTSIAPDMVFVRQRNSTTLAGMVVGDRLRGQPFLRTGSTAAEVNDADAFDKQIDGATEYGTAFSAMNGFWCGNDPTAQLNVSTVSNNQVALAFKRAPGFFDAVTYTGNGTTQTITHNLGVKPEMIIVKNRPTAGAGWPVYHANTPGGYIGNLTANTAIDAANNYANTITSVSSPNFGIAGSAGTNTFAEGYIAYLFATVSGVSKFGTYTGTAAVQGVNCGFSSSARFVLIKRTDNTGDWYVWDSARGIVAANDPYVLLNSTAAEVTTTDFIDTTTTGFEITAAASATINVNNATYIYMAIS